MADQQAGWYPDPSGDGTKLRYWDGAQWTENFADSGAAQAGVQAQPVQQEQPMQPIAEQTQPVQPLQPAPPQPAQPFEAAPPVQPFEAPQPAPAPPPQYAPQDQAPQYAPQAPQYAPQEPQAPQYAPQAPPQPAAAPYGAPAPKATKGKLFSIIAMGLAALGLLIAFIPILAAKTSFIWLSLILIVVSLAVGIVGVIMARGGKGPKGFTLAGVLAAVAALIITIIWLLIVAVNPAMVGQGTPQNNNNITITDPNIDNNNNNNTTITVPEIPDNNNTNNNNTNNNTQELFGDVTGQVGTTYSTRWFDFTVNSMQISQTYDSITARSGNNLVIVNVTITSTFDTPQPYGTFDWFLDDDTLSNYIWPLDPVSGSNNMMPEKFDLDPGQSVTYDVVIEYPSNLANPFFMYAEINANGDVFTSFKIPVR